MAGHSRQAPNFSSARGFRYGGSPRLKRYCDKTRNRAKARSTREDHMNHQSRNMKLATGLLFATLAGWLLAGCAQTAAPAPNIIERVQGTTPAPPPPSGF